jgi:hypothetical protein
MMATHDAQQDNGLYSREDSARRSTSPANTHHRRGYQACDPCRKRKVKCDLGSEFLYTLCGEAETRVQQYPRQRALGWLMAGWLAELADTVSFLF